MHQVLRISIRKSNCLVLLIVDMVETNTLYSFQWDPDMITFTANHDETVLSTSYWQQYLFGRYRGSHSLPVTNKNGDFNPLFWAASIDNTTNTVYFKVGWLLFCPISLPTLHNFQPCLPATLFILLTRTNNR